MCREISGFRLFAFCLMSNHVHLLIKVENKPLEAIMKRIGTRYVHWYNSKYDRTGHLFQDRYKSENVETDQYFLVVLRYIIQNPMKAGIEKEPGTYCWTSFRAYSEGRGSLTDTEFAAGYFASRDGLIAFLREPNSERAMDTDDFEQALTDEEAHALMLSLTNCANAASFQAMKSTIQRAYVLEMLKQGITPAQIVSLTGKSLAMVYRCKASLHR